jgi:hypothetical protein
MLSDIFVTFLILIFIYLALRLIRILDDWLTRKLGPKESDDE